jgi:hypothetical protein
MLRTTIMVLHARARSKSYEVFLDGEKNSFN